MAVKIGPLLIQKLSDLKMEGKLSSIAGPTSEVVMPVTAGMTMFSAFFGGVFNTATVVMQCSFNEAKTWVTLLGANTGNASATGTPVSAQTNVMVGWEAAIPAGVTHVRAVCTILTSGEVEVKLSQGSAMYEPAIGLSNGTLGASSSVIGLIGSPGVWTDISSTTLAKEASMAVPASVDLAAVATATAFVAGSTGVGEVRLSATADAVGKLFLETSRDNVTFKKIKSIELAQAPGCEWYGEIIHKPSERYARAAFTNGSVAAQTFFKCQMMRVGIA